MWVAEIGRGEEQMVGESFRRRYIFNNLQIRTIDKPRITHKFSTFFLCGSLQEILSLRIYCIYIFYIVNQYLYSESAERKSNRLVDVSIIFNKNKYQT